MAATDVMAEIAEFLRDRMEALLSLDLEKINAYRVKYGECPMPDDEVSWAGIHKARTVIADIPEEQKIISEEWLEQRGYSAMRPW